tara:strand:+ start:1867 stop:3048 length:1182 start_codon:yes stop_codon:yes gene_type:complete
MNDPAQRFAAFLAKKNASAADRSTMLKKNDTTGMMLVGLLDAVKTLPGKRSPGKIFVGLLKDRCKIYDDSQFELRGDDCIVVLPDDHNPEERSLRHMENVIIGGFEFEEGIADHVGGLVKCHGFHRNKAGYLVAKQVVVMTHTTTEKINLALSLPLQIPNIDFETCSDRYKGLVLQFRSLKEDHDDWKHTEGNACSMNTTNAKYRTDGDELLFKGSCDAMSYGEATKTYLVELYWPAVVCKCFGVTAVDAWEALAPTLLTNMRGFIKANIDVIKSSGLGVNDAKQETYAAGYSVYSNHVEVDVGEVLRTCGTKMDSTEVFEYFEEEYMLEYEHSADNPLNASTSLIKNLSEYSGNLKKVLDAEGVEFYSVSANDVTNVFVILSAPLSKKRKAK